MFKRNKAVVFLCLFGLLSNTSGVVMAQNQVNDQEEVSITGESLQGIETQRIEDNYDYQRTPKLDVDVTIEKEEENSGTGNDLIDTLINRQKNSIDTIDKLNSNQGDTSGSHGGTIPFVNF